MSFIQVNCPCGRTLRAKEEKAGETIRCWSCHEEVAVPHPRIGGKVVRQISDETRVVTSADSTFLIFGYAAVLSLALAVPYAGRGLALLLVIGAGLLYGEEVRRTGLPDRREPSRWTPRVWAARLAVATAVALGMLEPILLRHTGFESLGLRHGWGWAVALALLVVGWVGGPLALYAVSATGPDGPLGPRRALAQAWRFPWVTLPALAIVPLGLVLVELATVAVIYHQGWFEFMVVDLLPHDWRMVDPYFWIRGYLYVDIYTVPEPVFWKSYGYALAHRGTLVAGIPASLGDRHYVTMHPSVALSEESTYLAVRLLLSTLILTGLGSLLAIQARWLGVLPTIGARPRES